ncbi:dihydrolipoamide acetyltransferase family protein [Paenibacillus montanisoli]|uniref:Dihydrolipoamide acetyltransferase component of pyruvate dehydrogenase complex n=1 Tax=Paenibacillus montanisoli TaxID=2081970 RepID=A0A328U7V9_9BACL|nr:dihydrolipoamide acetyltransferase family protein [Paenibacillus montanisoli]RAP77903.1 dienelactone hydrolase [Paenibacillus montanisoli]
MPTVEYRLPDIGEGIHEADIVNWLIKPGDRVVEDQVIAEVESDKAIVEIPSPVNGTIRAIKVSEGTRVKVGDLLVDFEAEGAIEALGESAEAPETAYAAPEAQEVSKLPQAAGSGQASSKAIATPSVRKLAREQGVDLDDIVGTGKDGRITSDDIMRFVSGSAPAAAPAQQMIESVHARTSDDQPEVWTATAPAQQMNKTIHAQTSDDQPEVQMTAEQPSVRIAAVPESDLPESTPREERIPLKGIRKAISEAMIKSMYTAPQATIMDEVEVTKLVELRERIKSHAEKRAVKVTYLPFLIKCVIAACRQFPMMNASLDETTNEIVIKRNYHVGIAVDTEQGLLVPVVKDADRKNIWSIAEEMNRLITAGRQGKLTFGQLRGSTITITNIGSAGGMFFTPILNYPESAIVGMGRISEKPVVKQGEIVAAQVMSLSISFDHRIVDGATAQSFLNMIKTMMEQPDLILMEN